jgi:hypothetical protein
MAAWRAAERQGGGEREEVAAETPPGARGGFNWEGKGEGEERGAGGAPTRVRESGKQGRPASSWAKWAKFVRVSFFLFLFFFICFPFVNSNYIFK